MSVLEGDRADLPGISMVVVVDELKEKVLNQSSCRAWEARQ